MNTKDSDTVDVAEFRPALCFVEKGIPVGPLSKWSRPTVPRLVIGMEQKQLHSIQMDDVKEDENSIAALHKLFQTSLSYVFENTYKYGIDTRFLSTDELSNYRLDCSSQLRVEML